jgi:hypothetical protein
LTAATCRSACVVPAASASDIHAAIGHSQNAVAAKLGPGSLRSYA